MSGVHTNILNIFFFIFGGIFFLVEYLFPERKIQRQKEFSKDILAFVVLLLTGPLISTPLIDYYQSLENSKPVFLTEIPSVIKIIIATLSLDFLNYWIHFYMHKSNFYWKAHVFHHRITELYWFSGLRSSLGHYASFILSRVTIGVLIFRLTSIELLVYFSIGLFFNFYQHTNAKVANRWIEWILVSPRVHRLHHSTRGRRLINLGAIFSFWDRFFGTYLDPESASKDYDLGIPEDKSTSTKETILREVIGV